MSDLYENDMNYYVDDSGDDYCELNNSSSQNKERGKLIMSELKTTQGRVESKEDKLNKENESYIRFKVSNRFYNCSKEDLMGNFKLGETVHFEYSESSYKGTGGKDMKSKWVTKILDASLESPEGEQPPEGEEPPPAGKDEIGYYSVWNPKIQRQQEIMKQKSIYRRTALMEATKFVLEAADIINTPENVEKYFKIFIKLLIGRDTNNGKDDDKNTDQPGSPKGEQPPEDDEPPPHGEGKDVVLNKIKNLLNEYFNTDDPNTQDQMKKAKKDLCAFVFKTFNTWGDIEVKNYTDLQEGFEKMFRILLSTDNVEILLGNRDGQLIDGGSSAVKVETNKSQLKTNCELIGLLEKQMPAVDYLQILFQTVKDHPYERKESIKDIKHQVQIIGCLKQKADEIREKIESTQ